MSNEPKIAEIREGIHARVLKCTKQDLAKLGMLLNVLEANRRMHYLDALTAADELMCNRWVLMNTALLSHDEDVQRMMAWCLAVQRNGIKRRSETA